MKVLTVLMRMKKKKISFLKRFFELIILPNVSLETFALTFEHSHAISVQTLS